MFMRSMVAGSEEATDHATACLVISAYSSSRSSAGTTLESASPGYGGQD